MDKKIKEKINTILKKVIKKNRTIHPEFDLVEDLGFSSLDMMELLSNFEDEFNIIIPINKISNIKTVNDIYKEIENF